MMNQVKRKIQYQRRKVKVKFTPVQTVKVTIKFTDIQRVKSTRIPVAQRIQFKLNVFFDI